MLKAANELGFNSSPAILNLLREVKDAAAADNDPIMLATNKIKGKLIASPVE